MKNNWAHSVEQAEDGWSRVFMELYIISPEDQSIAIWCSDNATDQFRLDCGVVEFKNAEDAMMFYLAFKK